MVHPSPNAKVEGVEDVISHEKVVLQQMYSVNPVVFCSLLSILLLYHCSLLFTRSLNFENVIILYQTYNGSDLYQAFQTNVIKRASERAQLFMTAVYYVYLCLGIKMPESYIRQRTLPMRRPALRSNRRNIHNKFWAVACRSMFTSEVQCSRVRP